MPIIPIDEPSAAGWRGGFAFSARRPFFDETAVSFLHELSRALLKSPAARLHPDLVTFAYFCRRANLQTFAGRYTDVAQRSGWGTVVHVAPSNIPINFAFSLVFGLLAGNSNIVRMPSRSFPQNDVFVEIFDRTIAASEFSSIATTNVLVSSARGSDRFEALVAAADGLVVWGGDATVSAFRALPKMPRCAEIYFPDRRSSAVIDAAAVLALSPDARRHLAHDFFNDTYLVDQNACSSPSLVFWIGTPEAIAAAKDGFWTAVGAELQAQEYRLDPTARIDKCLDLMAITQTLGRPVHLRPRSPDIWCLEERSPPRDLPLRFGQFVEVDLPSVDGIPEHLRQQEQTLTYFGVDPQVLLHTVNRSSGHIVDRIVPTGQALNLDPTWDGKDVLALLSRRIDVVAPPRRRGDGAASVQAAIEA